MTEEKIIDGLKQIKEMFDNMKIYGNLFINRPDIYAGVVNSMLDLYNKQKEEIDYYKKQNEIKGKLLNTSLNETRKHCISKDKIRDKIKELEESISTYNEGDYYDPFYNTDYITRLKAQIIILKSLLLEEGDPDAK